MENEISNDENLNKMIEKYKADLMGYYKKTNSAVNSVSLGNSTTEARRSALPNAGINNPVIETVPPLSGGNPKMSINPDIDNEQNNNPPQNPNPETLKKLRDDDILNNITATGSLVVGVTTAKGAVPVDGAIVTVYRPTDQGDVLVAVKYTDNSGKTSVITLPTLPKELSETPGSQNTYISYNIRTQKPGYFIVENKNVPIYDSVRAIQNVDLIPVPENYKGNLVIDFYESGPQDL